MKCIHCQTDSTYPERQANGGRCKKCQHPFAFEPKTKPLGGGPLSDGLFQRLLDDVSSKGKSAFTDRQLWFELNRRIRQRQVKATRAGGIGCAAIGGGFGVFAAVALSSPIPLLLSGLGLALGAAIYLSAGGKKGESQPPLVGWAEFAPLLARWREVHGDPPRLADPRLPALLPGNQEPDLTGYSFDRALVTERSDLAAMLVASNFHFENNCAILSLDGYPEGRAGTVLEMLRRNPELRVFAVHDASIPGCSLVHRLRDPAWFPDHRVRIIDLGLRPKHAQELRLSALKAPPAHAAARDAHSAWREGLASEEIGWLAAGNMSELAELRPARLMRAIYQGFARANQLPDGSSAGAEADSGPGMIWFYHPGADIHAADSFG